MVAVQSKAVATPRGEPLRQAREIAVLIALELRVPTVGLDLDAPALGRPDPKVNASRGRLSAYREASRDVTRDADGHGS